MSLGENLRKARGSKSQIEVAKALAISANTLSSYERDRAVPSIEVFKNLCEILGLSADSLLCIKDISNNPENKGGMLAGKFANIRDNLGMSQKEIAKLVDVSTGTWSKYETGNRTPPLKRFQTICKECKVSADYLLGLSQKNQNKGD
ncbi:MAG: helix-turn-helix transcriptional regulator [Psychrobacillus psychrodurans]